MCWDGGIAIFGGGEVVVCDGWLRWEVWFDMGWDDGGGR